MILIFYREEKTMYVCCFNGCTFKHSKHREYVCHLSKVHRRGRLVCKYKGKCLRFFQKVGDLYKHIKVVHCAKKGRQVQCGGSRMFIPHPGSWFLPIPDPGSKNSNKRQGWNFFFVKSFIVATNFTKLNIIFFICWRKKFAPIFQELLKF